MVLIKTIFKHNTIYLYYFIITLLNFTLEEIKIVFLLHLISVDEGSSRCPSVGLRRSPFRRVWKKKKCISVEVQTQSTRQSDTNLTKFCQK